MNEKIHFLSFFDVSFFDFNIPCIILAGRRTNEIKKDGLVSKIEYL